MVTFEFRDYCTARTPIPMCTRMSDQYIANGQSTSMWQCSDDRALHSVGHDLNVDVIHESRDRQPRPRGQTAVSRFYVLIEAGYTGVFVDQTRPGSMLTHHSEWTDLLPTN